MGRVRYRTIKSRLLRAAKKNSVGTSNCVSVCLSKCVCACPYLQWRSLVARVHKAQSVPDHTHFDLFVNRTGNVFENSWCHLPQTERCITASPLRIPVKTRWSLWWDSLLPPVRVLFSYWGWSWPLVILVSGSSSEECRTLISETQTQRIHVCYW